MQRTQLEPFFQALRGERLALAWAAGAIAGAAAYFGWPSEVWWGAGLVPVGTGLVLVGLGDFLEKIGFRLSAFGFRGSLRPVGWFLVAAGFVFMLGGRQVESAGPEKGGLDWSVASRRAHWVVGRVEEMKEKEGARGQARVTLVLGDVKFYQLPGSEGIKQVRVSVYGSQARDLAVGDGVAMPVQLIPPEGPKYPGDRDSRIWRYMSHESVGAFVRGPVEKTVLPNDMRVDGMDRVDRFFDGLRGRIAAETSSVAGGVVTAMLNGDQRVVAREVQEAYRVTGLTHLIAISGMQLTLVAGGIFFLIRWLAACWPALALRVNVKFFAALAGLAGAGFYTLLAGAGVSVVRAFIMVALVMIAVLAGRLRGALRAWCVSVGVILAVSPMMVLSAGFQLSVAAVGALILWGMVEENRLSAFGFRHSGWGGWVWRGGRELVIASVVAGAATAPLLVWNFGQLSAVGLPANMVAVPLMGVATYLGMAALLLWPVGLEGPFVGAMGVVVELVNRWALWLAGWQGSVTVGRELTGAVMVISAVILAGVFRFSAFGFRLSGWWVLGGVVALAGLGWGVTRLTPAAEVMVLDGGKIGVLRDRVLWATEPNSARYVLRKLGTGAEIGPDTPRIADMQFFPPAKPGEFAYAEMRGGKWFVKHLSCGRVWERVDRACSR